jgi:hypothetical protein
VRPHPRRPSHQPRGQHANQTLSLSGLETVPAVNSGCQGAPCVQTATSHWTPSVATWRQQQQPHSGLDGIQERTRQVAHLYCVRVFDMWGRALWVAAQSRPGCQMATHPVQSSPVRSGPVWRATNQAIKPNRRQCFHPVASPKVSYRISAKNRRPGFIPTPFFWLTRSPYFSFLFSRKICASLQRRVLSPP